jgi:hypothetical protein
MNAWDVTCTPTITSNERPQQGVSSMLANTIGTQSGVISFKTGLSGDGTVTATAPGWLETLLPACGIFETGGTGGIFSPLTAAPSVTAGTGVNHTVTISVFEDGLKKTITGAMGTFTISATAGDPVVIEWTFTGVWAPVTDVSLSTITPTYDAILPLVFRTATLTVGGSAPGCVSSFAIDIGNTVELRQCATKSSGFESAIITDRKVVGSMDPESRLVTTEDVFGEWLAGSELAFSLALDDGIVTDTVTIAAPQIQRTNISPGDRNGILVDGIDFACNSASTTGDDELTITFS